MLLGMASYQDEDWRRLGAAVRSARYRVGVRNTEEWAELVGKTTRTLLGLERGESVGRETLTAVENALSWKPGTATRILDNADLGPVGDGFAGSVAHALRRSRNPELARFTVDEMLDEISGRYLEAVSRLHALGAGERIEWHFDEVGESVLEKKPISDDPQDDFELVARRGHNNRGRQLRDEQDAAAEGSQE